MNTWKIELIYELFTSRFFLRHPRSLKPILVGHYSEKRDRNYRAKIESKFDNGFNLLKKSEYLEDKISRLEERQAPGA